MNKDLVSIITIFSAGARPRDKVSFRNLLLVSAGARPRDQILVLGSGPKVKFLS